MRISDWSSDVCSSDLEVPFKALRHNSGSPKLGLDQTGQLAHVGTTLNLGLEPGHDLAHVLAGRGAGLGHGLFDEFNDFGFRQLLRQVRSEEHTSELQSLMRISYAVFCLQKKKNLPHTK